MKRKQLKTLIKYPGGKSDLAGSIVSLMNGIQHKRYLEPFFGAGSVLLAKDPSGIVEIANDIYQHNYAFWATLRDKDAFEEFARMCHATPVCEATWQNAQEMLSNHELTQVEQAYAFFVSYRLSRQGSKSFATLSRRPRRQQNEAGSAYWSAVDRLPELHKRLAGVFFYCRDALRVIEGQDGSDRLMYLDPPYIQTTRVSKQLYEHEMSDEDHHNLVDLLLTSKSKVLLSGYDGSERIYHRLEAKGWGVWERLVTKHSSSKKTKPKARERIWSNCELDTESAEKWAQLKPTKLHFTGFDLQPSNPQKDGPVPVPTLIPAPSCFQQGTSPTSPSMQPTPDFVPCPLTASSSAPSKSPPPWLNLKPLIRLTPNAALQANFDKHRI